MASPFKRIRDFFESIIFAGLQPGSRTPRKSGALSGTIDRFLSGPAPTDPLYLTNRSTAQKVKMRLLIGVPCAMVAGFVIAMLTGAIRFGTPRPMRDPTPAEIAAKVLPNLDSVHVSSNNDVEVLEVRVEHGPQTVIAGSMKNTTGHEIPIAEAVFDLTDSTDSQLGGVSARVENFMPGATANFRVPIPQSEAQHALVREIHVQ